MDSDQKFWLCSWLILMAAIVAVTAVIAVYSVTDRRIRADLLKSGKSAMEIECMDTASGSHQAAACSILFATEKK